MEILPFGDRGLLITGIDPMNLDSLFSHLEKAFILEPAPYFIRRGLDTILVESKSPGIKIDVIRNLLDSWIGDSGLAKNEDNNLKIIEIPCLYDGEDLKALSESLNIDVNTISDMHKNTLWKVALVGFAPGFPYLLPYENKEATNLFQKIARLETPRTSVPAGSVAVAAGMSAIYPSKMPGGWNLIGRTELLLFDAMAATPSLLQTGDIVRFVEVHQ